MSENPTETPIYAKTVVSVKANIPVQPYGGIDFFVSQEIFAPVDTDNGVLSELIIGNAQRLRDQIALMVLPLAEAEVERCASVLGKEQYPDAWLQRNSPVYRWLRVAAPDMTIPAMSPYLTDKS